MQVPGLLGEGWGTHGLQELWSGRLWPLPTSPGAAVWPRARPLTSLGLCHTGSWAPWPVGMLGTDWGDIYKTLGAASSTCEC